VVYLHVKSFGIDRLRFRSLLHTLFTFGDCQTTCRFGPFWPSIFFRLVFGVTYAGLSLCRVFATFPVQFDTSLGRRPVCIRFSYIYWPIVLEFTHKHTCAFFWILFRLLQQITNLSLPLLFLKIMPPKKNSVASKASTNTSVRD